MHPGKLEILGFWDITTSEFLLNLPFEKFEGFEVSETERTHTREKERERERAHGIFGVLIFNGLVVILYVLYIFILMCI